MKKETVPRSARFPIHIPVLLAGVLVTALLVSLTAWADVRQRKETTLHTLEVYSARLEALLEGLFHKTDVLESIIITSGGDVPKDVFEDLAKSLSDGQGIRAIQYLPDGIVKYCYPVEGNELAVGDNIFENPKRREDALLALNTKKIALSGPYSLTQGGLGLVARNPIFLTGPDGKETFWGFSVIVLDLPEALGPILLEELGKDGYVYRLHCLTETGEDVSITEGGQVDGMHAVDYSIHVPNHVWTLTLAPEKGWVAWGKILAELLLGICISVLFGIITFQNKEKARVLHYFATTDELTGLFNRRWLDETVDALCKEKGRPFTLVYMDLNEFKGINDTLGHSWGDVLLRDFSRRIQTALGEGAVLARVGGDEFVAVLGGGNRQEAERAVTKIRESMALPFTLDGAPKAMSVSIGCALFPDEGLKYDALLRIADERMYTDKRKAGGRICPA